MMIVLATYFGFVAFLVVCFGVACLWDWARDFDCRVRIRRLIRREMDQARKDARTWGEIAELEQAWQLPAAPSLLDR